MALMHIVNYLLVVSITRTAPFHNIKPTRWWELSEKAIAWENREGEGRYVVATFFIAVM